MKTTSPAAAMALAALYAKDKLLVERSFSHLTAPVLQALDKRLLQEWSLVNDDTATSNHKEQDCHAVVAQACIRRMAHRYLDKFAQLPTTDRGEVEGALKFHTLPLDLQEQLAANYGSGTTPDSANNNNNKHDADEKDSRPQSQKPTTWYEALEQLKVLATPPKSGGVLDKGHLWRLLLDHPMTAYVPVQCQACGHVLPDETPSSPQQQRDKDQAVGLHELAPTGDELELRAGWFRGPRRAVVFQWKCSRCQQVSQWYRSGHPQIMLNPHKWGRLCGEQEDLRLTLAHCYLNIPVRLVVPLDWDHVWSEYQATTPTPAQQTDELSQSSIQSSPVSSSWQVHDDSARNFCCRLEEGIGSWTRVWAIHSNPEWCQDVTQDYLTSQKQGGRVDNHHTLNDNKKRERYTQMVQAAREDASGNLTQAKTVNGYVLARANLSDEEITRELQRAAQEYGTKKWWQLHT